MIHICYFQRNGSCNWEVKVSALVIAVLAILAIGFMKGENTAGWIVALFRH